MAKMDEWITNYRQRLVQKDAEAQKKEEKKRKLLEEAREYFGYYVDPRDAKFQVSAFECKWCKCKSQWVSSEQSQRDFWTKTLEGSETEVQIKKIGVGVGFLSPFFLFFF